MVANQESIRLYMEAARRSLAGAQYNFDGGFWSIATSRSYYACFYAASALLLTKDITRSKHSAVLAAFRQYFVKEGEIEAEYSDILGEAFDLRQVADYDMVGFVDESRAQAMIDNTRRFVERAADFLKDAGYS